MNLDFGPSNDPSEDPADDPAGSPLIGGEEERDILVVLRLSNRQMGTDAERAEITMLADQLSNAVQDAGVGEYDGDEFGGGECILFFCGPDEMKLLGFLRSMLQRSSYARGAHFVRLIESADGEMQRENIPL